MELSDCSSSWDGDPGAEMGNMLDNLPESPDREHRREEGSASSCASSDMVVGTASAKEESECMSLGDVSQQSDVDEAGPLDGGEGSDGSDAMDLGDSESEPLGGNGGGRRLCSSPAVCGGGGWRPGADCGVHLSARDAPPQIQAQVLITNVYLNLKRLPAAIAKAIWSHLTPGGDAILRNFADRLASKFMGVSHSMARRIHDRLRDCGWNPAAGEAGVSAAARSQEQRQALAGDVARASGHAAPERRALLALKIRAREALSVAHWGEPDTSYERSLERLQQHGMQLGTKYLTSHFVEPVEFLAAAAARARTADVLSRPLASLGIPSDVALVFDGVSIGSSSFSRHETLYLIGFTCMSAASGELGSFSGSSGRHGVSARSRAPAPLSLQAKLMGAPSAGQQHAGREQVELLFKSLREHPGRFGRRELQARLAAVASDGAGTRGGEDSVHASTGGGRSILAGTAPERKH